MRSPDRILLVLVGLLSASLAAFFLGLIPYPFGLLVLLVLIVARILSLQGPDRDRR